MPYNAPNAREFTQQPTEGSGRDDHDAILFNEAYSTQFTSTATDSEKSSKGTAGDATAWLVSADSLLFDFGVDTETKTQPPSVTRDHRKVDAANELPEKKIETTKPIAAADKPAPVDKPVPTSKDIPAGRLNSVEGADPLLLSSTDADLTKMISDKSGKPQHVEDVKNLYKELIRRYDSDFTKADFDKSIPSIKLLLDGLKTGKDLTDGPDGKRILGTDKLTEERR